MNVRSFHFYVDNRYDSFPGEKDQVDRRWMVLDGDTNMSYTGYSKVGSALAYAAYHALLIAESSSTKNITIYYRSHKYNDIHKKFLKEKLLHLRNNGIIINLSPASRFGKMDSVYKKLRDDQYYNKEEFSLLIKEKIKKEPNPELIELLSHEENEGADVIFNNLTLALSDFDMNLLKRNGVQSAGYQLITKKGI